MGLNRLSAAATTLLATSAIFLAGCDGGASAVRAPKNGERTAAADTVDAPSPAEPRRGDPRDAPVRLVSGKPFWAANRTRTAEENAQRGFERNGEAFNARTVDDYVAKAHAFVSDPPKSAETLKRANGDTLIYDAKSNVFAVVSKEGAPRAMFKPDDGETYWDVQKAQEARRATAARDKDQTDS